MNFRFFAAALAALFLIPATTPVAEARPPSVSVDAGDCHVHATPHGVSVHCGSHRPPPRHVRPAPVCGGESPKAWCAHDAHLFF